ncbi:MAG: 4Fe-4S dicluster domain-containing protein [Nitrospinota bacterium]|nr:4Fe-4S dicluster domain-containing protein [Nitrospinota bacterium]
MNLTPTLSFAEEIRKRSGEDVNLCYQCGRCSAGCPTSYIMDVVPHRLIHSIRLGREEFILGSKTMWLCASCETCSTRCPRDIDIAKIMDNLKILSVEKGIKTPVPEVSAFYSSALNSIRRFGRIHELSMVTEIKLKTHQFMRDLKLGLQMMRMGKIKLLPETNATRRGIVRDIFANVKKREKGQ